MTPRKLTEEELDAAVERCCRRIRREERRERFGDPEKFDRFTGSWMTLGEEMGQ